MCNALVVKRSIEAVGEFMKGNEPAPIRMPVVAVQCECGAWYVRTRSGSLWVEAEKAA